MKQYKKSLFIFRRDLRVADNTALAQACAQSQIVIACFIIDPRQVTNRNNYKSDNALQYMAESLADLHKQLQKHKGKLYVLQGQPYQVVAQLIKREKIEAVFCNYDYTPFSIERDKKIAQACRTHHCVFEQSHDALLHDPTQIKKSDGKPYTMFTPFFKKARALPVAKSMPLARGASFYAGTLAGTLSVQKMLAMLTPVDNDAIAVHGGSAVAQKLVRQLKKFDHYARTKDVMSLDTTHLSAPLKFGTVSVRTVYHEMVKQLGVHHPLIRQLYWRDFFTYVAYHNPIVFGHSYNPRYRGLRWSNNKKHIAAWCAGKTGFPIVDAGMRQLNETGFMHNRVRMIVASLLIKDLHVDWRVGERYFAQKLVDYDPAVNNGNWQWVASTGCDAQPYFRIFNPWLQQKKFDRDCVYIKRWVPELRDVSNKVIHTWFKAECKVAGYPKPIVEHAQEAGRAKKQYAAHYRKV